MTISVRAGIFPGFFSFSPQSRSCPRGGRPRSRTPRCSLNETPNTRKNTQKHAYAHPPVRLIRQSSVSTPTMALSAVIDLLCSCLKTRQLSKQEHPLPPSLPLLVGNNIANPILLFSTSGEFWPPNDPSQNPVLIKQTRPMCGATVHAAEEQQARF